MMGNLCRLGMGSGGMGRSRFSWKYSNVITTAQSCVGNSTRVSSNTQNFSQFQSGTKHSNHTNAHVFHSQRRHIHDAAPHCSEVMSLRGRQSLVGRVGGSPVTRRLPVFVARNDMHTVDSLTDCSNRVTGDGLEMVTRQNSPALPDHISSICYVTTLYNS